LKRDDSENVEEKPDGLAGAKPARDHGSLDVMSKVSPIQGNKKLDTPAFERNIEAKEEKAFESKINPLKYNDEIDHTGIYQTQNDPRRIMTKKFETIKKTKINIA